jgi:hypothetical protein
MQPPQFGGWLRNPRSLGDSLPVTELRGSSYRTVIAKGALLVPSTATASGTWAPANDCVRMI